MGLYNPQSRLIFKGHKWLNYSQITVCLSVCLYLRVYGDGTYSLLKKKFITKPMKQCFSYNIVLCCDMICDSAMLVKRCFHFAHYDRPQRFLAGTGGFSRKKILFCLKGPVKLCLQINFLSLNPFFRLILMFLFRYCILW